MIPESLYPKINAALPAPLLDALVRSLDEQHATRWGIKFPGEPSLMVGFSNFNRWTAYRDDRRVICGGALVSGGFLTGLGYALAKAEQAARRGEL